MSIRITASPYLEPKDESIHDEPLEDLWDNVYLGYQFIGINPKDQIDEIYFDRVLTYDPLSDRPILGDI